MAYFSLNIFYFTLWKRVQSTIALQQRSQHRQQLIPMLSLIIRQPQFTPMLSSLLTTLAKKFHLLIKNAPGNQPLLWQMVTVRVKTECVTWSISKFAAVIGSVKCSKLNQKLYLKPCFLKKVIYIILKLLFFDLYHIYIYLISYNMINIIIIYLYITFEPVLVKFIVTSVSGRNRSRSFLWSLQNWYPLVLTMKK